MNDRRQNEILNALLINLGRSLLQYTVEAWPWTNAAEQELRDDVYDLADRQAQAVAALADYLGSRNWAIDFGIYPVEYTDLHYVSLDFLLEQLAQNAEELAVDTHETRRLIGDPAGSDLLLEIDGLQQSIAARLRELADAVIRRSGFPA